MFKVEGQDRSRGGRTGAIDLLYQRTTRDGRSEGGSDRWRRIRTGGPYFCSSKMYSASISPLIMPAWRICHGERSRQATDGSCAVMNCAPFCRRSPPSGLSLSMIDGSFELLESFVFRVGLFEFLSLPSVSRPVIPMAGSEGKNGAWDVQSEEAKRLLAEDKYDDCLSCRVTGELVIWAP